MSCPPGDSYPRFISNLKVSSSKKAISLWPAIMVLDNKSVTPSNAGYYQNNCLSSHTTDDVETDAPSKLDDNPDAEHTKAPHKYVRNADDNFHKLWHKCIFHIAESFICPLTKGDLAYLGLLRFSPHNSLSYTHNKRSYWTRKSASHPAHARLYSCCEKSKSSPSQSQEICSTIP